MEEELVVRGIGLLILSMAVACCHVKALQLRYRNLMGCRDHRRLDSFDWLGFVVPSCEDLRFLGVMSIFDVSVEQLLAALVPVTHIPLAPDYLLPPSADPDGCIARALVKRKKVGPF